MRISPPARASTSQTGFVNPLGPHHCATCLGSTHAWKTRCRGASKARVISRSHFDSSFVALVFALFADMLLLLILRAAIFRVLPLEFPQVDVQPIETCLPAFPVVLHPSGHILQRTRLEATWPPLRLPPARDQPCVLQHLQML